MKFLLVGKNTNNELYRLMDLMEAEGLNVHNYLAKLSNSPTCSSDLSDDEIIDTTTLSEDDYVLVSKTDNKIRRTTIDRLQKADVITISPEQVKELAALLPEDHMTLILVMEHDVSMQKPEEYTLFDAKLNDMFNNFSEIAEDTTVANVIKYDAESTDSDSFSKWLFSKWCAHHKLKDIIWQLIDIGSIEYVGDVDTNGKPMTKDGGFVMLYKDKNQTDVVPIDVFTEIVMSDDEGLAACMRIYLSNTENDKEE